MAREIDDKKKRKVLRKLRKAARRAEAEGGPGLSDWEREFVEEVEARVEKYGSAFADPDKGRLDEPLSALQSHKLKEIDKKSRGKSTLKRSSFRSHTAKKATNKTFTPRSRDIHEDVTGEAEDALPAEAPPRGETPRLVVSEPRGKTGPSAKDDRPTRRPGLRIVRLDEDTG